MLNLCSTGQSQKPMRCPRRKSETILNSPSLMLPRPTTHLSLVSVEVSNSSTCGQVATFTKTYPNTLLEVDGRLLVHASAATHVHGFVAPGASSMVTYELRLDGFVYLSSNASDGGNASLTTKAITWRGGDLLINADAKRSAGSSVSLGVLDKSGAKLLFTMGDFLGMNYADAVAEQDLPALEGTILIDGESANGESWDAFITRCRVYACSLSWFAIGPDI